MNATVVANVVAWFMKRIAKLFCCPNGGLPITNTSSSMESDLGARLYVKKSFFIIRGFSGDESMAMQSGIWSENEPLPALGSITASNLEKSNLANRCFATSGLV
jgi:hypothetical protein